MGLLGRPCNCVVRHFKGKPAIPSRASTQSIVTNAQSADVLGTGSETNNFCRPGDHKDHHHFIDLDLVAGVQGNTVKLSKNADAAIAAEQEA